MASSIMFFRLSSFLVFLFILFSLKTAYAHPHVFIDNRIKVLFDDNGLEGIAVEWQFDVMFSNMLISDYDRNKNKKFEPDEIAKIEKQAFSNLAKYNYFSYIIIENHRFDIDKVSGFSAEISGKKVKYSFFIPFEYPYEKIKENIFLGFFDKTIYCDFQFMPKNPYDITAPPDIEITAKMISNKNFWSIKRAPEEILIKLKRTQR